MLVSAIKASNLRFGRTEQFRPTAELMAFIGRPLLVDPNPGVIEAIEVGVPVKLNRAIVSKARLIAAHRGTTVADFLADILRGPVDKAYVQMVKELEKES